MPANKLRWKESASKDKFCASLNAENENEHEPREMSYPESINLAEIISCEYFMRETGEFPGQQLCICVACRSNPAENGHGLR